MAKYKLMFPSHDEQYYVYVRLEGTDRCWYQFHKKNQPLSPNVWSRGAGGDLPLFDTPGDLFAVEAPTSWCRINKRLKALGYNITTPPEVPK